MLGGSFVFGDNVGPRQTLPKALERRLGTAIGNQVAPALVADALRANGLVR